MTMPTGNCSRCGRSDVLLYRGGGGSVDHPMKLTQHNDANGVACSGSGREPGPGPGGTDKAPELWTVQLTRKEVAYREVIVLAKSQRAARRRALALARYEAVEAREGEDEGEWCDNTVGRTVVRSVKKGQ